MSDHELNLGTLLRCAGSPEPSKEFPGVQVRDPRLAAVLPADTPLLVLHEGSSHAEGPVWDRSRGILYWSDVPNRRLLALHPDGRVETALERAFFMNGNALDAEGHLMHCEHGRRCISRSAEPDQQPEPIITPFEGKRLNAPNDLAVAPDGIIRIADPTFGILMPNPGSIAEPELDHRSVELRRTADGVHVWTAERERLGFIPTTQTVSDLCFGGLDGNRLFMAATKHLPAIDLVV